MKKIPKSQSVPPAPEHAEPTETPPEPDQRSADRDAVRERRESRRWWIKLFLQPALFLTCGALLIVGLGWAQRLGWISASGNGQTVGSTEDSPTRFICPMMCTPPQTEPGRCPVCDMKLVPASSGAGQGPSASIQIDPVARRVANIETARVRKTSMRRTLNAIGKLQYDEGNRKTISAYVDGRLDKLYADYTGIVVKEGDHLALVYSPELYSGQVEMLLAKNALEESQNSTLRRVTLSNQELYENSKQRLIELGMTESQIAELEHTGKASSRLHLCAPISGTVIKKHAVEGEYVKEGDVIYQVADLSTVWLMLELFPDDAANIRYGQNVSAEVQSLPGREFTGRVAFVDPHVDSKTRTVSVRVVIPNEDGRLRVGDYAKAKIDVPLNGPSEEPRPVYDPTLANKWISPRHPHVVESSPGQCRVCGVDLVPASQLGFTDEAGAKDETLVVPRSAVLMAGNTSVVYVETEPGRFEIRRVVLGPSWDDQMAILEGVKAGEQVATQGNFLIDSQMQLAGNPSLIDPTKAMPRLDVEPTPLMLVEIMKLPKEDRSKATQQRICPVTRLQLGSMGPPIKVNVQGRDVFLCCSHCKKRLRDDPEKHLANLSQPSSSNGNESSALTKALAKLGPEDRALAEAQGVCPVADMKLGSMGPPQKVTIQDTPVFLCCEACRESLLEDPEKYLAKLKSLDSDEHSAPNDQSTSLPPIGVPEAIEPMENQDVRRESGRKSPIKRMATQPKEGPQ